MLQLESVASPAIYTMLALCFLSIGFMIRFLVALAMDGRKTHIRNAFRLGEDCSSDVASQEPDAAKVALIQHLTSLWESSGLPPVSVRNPARNTGRQRLAGSIMSHFLSEGGISIPQSNMLSVKVKLRTFGGA